MRAKLRRIRSLIRQYGLRRCAFRLRHNLLRRTGLLKLRFPTWQWTDRPLSHWLASDAPSDPQEYVAWRAGQPGRFFFPPGQPPKPPAAGAEQAVAQAERLLQGEVLYFSRQWGRVGWPRIDWFTNPFTGQSDPPTRHWCDLSDFDADRGDIKYLWEPSRFCWAYALVRAYAATGEDRYAEAFWSALESWLAANPPQMGVNWQCGQEIAIRAMACTFALYGLWSSPATTPQRVASLVVLLAGSAERIAGNIAYARAQMGNHAPSEAAALYTVGTCFPELRQAARWRRLAVAVLDAEAREFNSPDGSYTQHSMNYHRLMLHDYLWCLRLAECGGPPLAGLTRDRLEASYRFIHQLQDPATGRVPNYGPNDGALILPLDGCDYLDYRPVTATMHYLFHRARLHEPGPWDETLLWLFGPEAMDSPVHPEPHPAASFPDGGYYTLRGGESWAMLRCHSYRSRPNQADMLHLDLWWRGANVLRDSGTYTYFDPQTQWNRYFVSTSAHNTVEVGGEDQMVKGPRFQWNSLVESRLLGRERRDGVELWQAEHYGYRRLASRAVHRRCVARIGEGLWLVVDDVLGAGGESARLFWHFADAACELAGRVARLALPAGEARVAVACTVPSAGVRLAHGLDGPVRAGWQSLYYGERTATPSLIVEARGELPIRFVTLIGLACGIGALSLDAPDTVRWRGDAGADRAIRLAPPGADGMAILDAGPAPAP